MTNLSNRVQKSKCLKFREVSGLKNSKIFGCWGSRGDHYQTELTSATEVIITPDQKLKVDVIQVSCNSYPGVGVCKECKGNNQHTICYHGLGAIRKAFDDVEKSISFFDNYQDAMNFKQFGGKLAKVRSLNGKGSFIWAVIQKPQEPKNLNNVAIQAMRGDESDEGID